ncbi:MAG: ATPase domain-containing protein, partial [Casimicrobiaceae bacterium]
AGVFVAFEEDSESILVNAATFGWGLPALLDRRLFIVNANVSPDTVQTGNFDLGGLLSAIGGLVKQFDVRWIVFDAIDVLLSLLDSPGARRRELFRIRAWLKLHALTCIITMKEEPGGDANDAIRESISYVADCVVRLERVAGDSVASRRLRIMKYRGSAHSENSVPYWIGRTGIEVDPQRHYTKDYPVFSDRISTGVERLDNMLGAGIFRGSITLLTGAPGTSKTTLCGKFAEAACVRGERTLYLCLDESPQEIVRNLKSVNIDLAKHIASGLLHMHGTVMRQRSADSVFAEIRELLDTVEPSCFVIDPISALKAVGDDAEVLNTVHRIIQQCKSRGVSVYMASIVTKGTADIENSDSHVSTLADNWMHLSYLVRGGERNRALTIVKARGTGHSNQVRELILSDSGIALTDVFTEDGEVLMGTMRAQKEGEMEQAREVARREEARKVHDLETGAAELDENIMRLQRELEERRRQLAMLKREDIADAGTRTALRDAQGVSRGIDVPAPPAQLPQRARAGRK